MAARLGDALLQRLRPPPAVVRLEHVQRRIEIVLMGLYGRRMPIAAVDEHARRPWVQRVLPAARTNRRVHNVFPDIHAGAIRLPSELPAPAHSASAMLHYQLLAIEQAERLLRDTAAFIPTEPLERDLFLLREGLAVDSAIVRTSPGLLPALTAARCVALAERPALTTLTAAEQEVELLLRAALRSTIAGDSAERATAERTPSDCLAWAHECASRLRAIPGAYHGLAPVFLWGAAPRPHGDRAQPATAVDASASSGVLNLNIPARAAPSGAGQSGQPDANATVAEGPPDDSRADAQRLDPAARMGAMESATGRAEEPGDAAHHYPEWDHASGRYRQTGAMVRSAPAAVDDSDWANSMLAQHASLVRRLQQQFERLRARRMRLDRQQEGDELDLAACVHAIVDRRTGHAPDDRRYATVRPARRALAIALLADVSGSTNMPISGTLQIIDVEKIALLLASQAFDALGDAYTVLAFAGKGAGDVRVTTIKAFTERNGDTPRRRIAALTPAGFTRLGAAVRHATAQLSVQRAGHRLLLILSDGRPNDVDQYQGQYGVEDSRQAIVEARACGVYPYCLTVDREGSEYLPRIFGSAGHTILRQPEQLPLALLIMVRRLLAS